MSPIPSNYKRIENSKRAPRKGAKLVGPSDPNEILTVSVRVRRRSDAPPLPDPAGLSATPIGERGILSREEFAAHFGAAQSDLDKVAAFARTHGLTVVESSIPRRTVVLSGTVAQMNEAFAVSLNHYETADEKYRGREGHVSIPAELAEIVEGVFGLDNRQMAKPLVKISEGAISPAQSTSPVTPPQVAQLYGFPTSPNASGQTIGIFEFGGGYKVSDISSYCAGLHVATPSLTAISVDGQTNNPGPDNYSVETNLDISVAGTAAPGAKLAVYFAPWTEQGWVDVVTTAIHDAVNKPSVISVSYGWPENETFGQLTWSQQAINAVSQTFQEAAAMGVTIFVSSGDNGSSCGVGDGKAHVLYPGSDPYVTCVGGTTISNVSGTNYTETTWTPTGGGISDIFKTLPAWQAFANVPVSVNDGHHGRGVPDVAGNADPNSGYKLVFNGASYGPVGGTSAAAPLYAALTALLNAGMGEPLGYLNPNLYTFTGNYVYRDIADNASNASGGALGYKSVAGWDACTGFGSIVGTAMETALRGVGLPPALAVFNGKLYMVWKGIERDDRVFFSSFNGTTWAPQQQVPGILSSSGVALAVFNNKLYMAWKGMLSDEGIWFTSFNGTTWAPQQNVSGIGTSTGPRLAVLGNALYMGWKGVEGDQRIFWSKFNGTSWTAQQFIPNVATSVGPALAVYNNVLYMVWKGWYGDQGIYYSSFNGVAWAPQKQIAGVGTSEGPSLAVYGNSLYAVWKGQFGDQTMWYSNFNGASWAPQKQIAGIASSVGPGIAVFNNALYASWKGELGDQAIWYSHFNGATWAPQIKIAGVGTSPDLAKTASGAE